MTLVGVLARAKLGWIVVAKDRSVYIHTVREADAPKMKALESLSGQRVKVTGTLRYSPGSPPARGGEVEASVPEHFFFDVAEARVVGLGRPRTKHANRSRSP